MMKMPRHCSAGGCKSRDNRETRDAGITFHKLPKRAARRNLWITNSHRAASWEPQTDFVYFCSKHFTSESFEVTSCSGIRRLKEDAFPTVFDTTSKNKGKGTSQSQDYTPVRRSLCTGEQRANGDQTLEEPTGQRSVSAETHENKPASSQEPSGQEQLSLQEHATSPCGSPEARPLSPSQYMRRLPPPPGFYLSKEHSYAQLCPLLWRRRYNQAIAYLEKAIRLLNAAKRRESRLRSTMLRLRDKKLKHTLLVSQDGCKSKASWAQARRTTNQEDIEDTGILEDKGVAHFGLGWSEEEKGFCFYCGRGQVIPHKDLQRL
ncbi:THAP domain-containing protein 7 [Echeneis naucrates]|uniref:THAP domain-containing protein 7 n=1 Tax=Echeneis naucrates TaxID=173247 RepID=UPI001113DB71|nr:THAP domain-containing protein 7 [Echeneis naucrates]